MENPSILSRLKFAIVKHPVITISFAVAGLFVTSVYMYLTPAVYKSIAVIEAIKPQGTTAAPSIISSGKTASTEEITSESFVTTALKDKITTISYYVEQDFQTRYSIYGFPFLVQYNILGAKFNSQSYTIKALDDNSYMISSMVHGINRVKTGKFEEELIDGDLAITVTKKKHNTYQSAELLVPASYSFTIQSPTVFANNLLKENKGIEASEANGLITISCKHESAQKAKEITEALSQHYLQTRNSGVNPINPGNPSVDHQLAEMSLQLEATEQQIADFKRQNSITEIDFDTEQSLDILKNLQLQKSQLKLTLAALENTSTYLRKNRETNNSNVDYGTISDPVFSEQIALLNSKYELKEAGQATTATDGEIEAIKTSIAERILNTRKKTTVQINKINQEIAAVNRQLATIPEKANMLKSLDRKLALDKKVYDLLSEKRAQALVTGTGVITSGGKILKPASFPLTPVNTAPWILILGGIISGILASIPFSLIAEKIRSGHMANRQEIDKQTRIPFIGTIAQDTTSGSGIEASISTLSTRVLLRQDVKMVTFASTNKGEGKTFIATHFAQAFAAMDKKVLVIDMNAGNPAVASHYQVTPERSLADVLEGNCDIHDAICITSYPNLDVLECGQLHAGVNSLLASEKRKTIFDSLKRHYDIIVTDTPDIGTQIDAIPMMKMSDLNLFVVNANTTRKQSLVTAEQINTDYELQNLFLLLNSVKQVNYQQAGSTRRSRIRNSNNPKIQKKEAYVPTMLRKIALWFY